jgi:hypothetical protein
MALILSLDEERQVGKRMAGFFQQIEEIDKIFGRASLDESKAFHRFDIIKGGQRGNDPGFYFVTGQRGQELIGQMEQRDLQFFRREEQNQGFFFHKLQIDLFELPPEFKNQRLWIKWSRRKEIEVHGETVTKKEIKSRPPGQITIVR